MMCRSQEMIQRAGVFALHSGGPGAMPTTEPGVVSKLCQVWYKNQKRGLFSKVCSKWKVLRNLIRMSYSLGRRDSTGVKCLPCTLVTLVWSQALYMCPLAPLGVIPEHRNRHKPWASSGVFQIPKTNKKSIKRKIIFKILLKKKTQ